MQFQYVALDTNGREVSGLISARSMREAQRLISEDGRIPISTTAAGSSTRSAGASGRKPIKQRDAAPFVRRLSELLLAGVPLERALKSLTQSETGAAAEALLKKVQEGDALSEAVLAHGAPFAAFHAALIKAGEASGRLGPALDELASILENQNSLRAQIVSSLTYPALLSVVSCLVFSGLMTFVVPRFETLFADAGATLPLITQITLSVSRAVGSFWWLPLVLFIAGALSLQRLQKMPIARVQLSEFALTLPVFGRVRSQAETARYTHILGSLLQAGVRPHRAAALSADVASTSAYAGRARNIANRVKRGEAFSVACQSEGFGDGALLEIMRVGEATGALGTSLVNASRLIENNVRNRIDRIVALAEPMIILALAFVIGAVIVSLFIGIMSINDLAI
ncbi:MAG: type II secretion system F family protein [Pseudomonadota bacterium]